ncbi:deoxyribose-phosphate aldolase [Parabacteroides sp. FAFU027]|uniref:deoxyribose-phosphate aldolase n=1 Tax=Parabacteroides sp. FAFU027 TaxID=2922715 RepID=UPI001FAFF636|nr:deoxyribose-phosphate aldolase [Parabacteroides sp. FAFU027]
MSKYIKTLNEYNITLDDQFVSEKVEQIINKNLQDSMKEEVFKKLFSCIDLTSLNNTDNTQQIINFVEKVNRFDQEFPQLDNVAAVCVYPNFTGIVQSHLEVENVKIAAVSAGFPGAQTYTEIKVAETSLTVMDGADEIDIVMNLGNFTAGEFEELTDEISEIKDACREAHLKVILETGTLKTASNIKKAAVLAMYSGADFIKTSTGKTHPAATLEAAYVMCEAIKEYYLKTDKMIGFKAAGGIVTSEDAVKYYCIVKEVLGENWLNKEHFRIGASRLANNLLGDIFGKQINFF